MSRFFNNCGTLHYTEFKECDACHLKPGTPTLCPSCFHNRELILYLELKLELVAVTKRAAAIERLLNE